jgi:hypothetical protein
MRNSPSAAGERSVAQVIDVGAAHYLPHRKT